MFPTNKEIIETLRRRLEEKEIESFSPLFSVDVHDSDGDVVEEGIFLHFGNASVKVGKTMNDYDLLISKLKGMRMEILSNLE